MDGKITCDCWVTLIKKQLSRHKKSKRHLDYINKKSLDLTNDDKEPDAEDPRNEESNDEDVKLNEVDESDEEEVVEVKAKQQKSHNNKFHLDAIRQKAIAKIKEKKQAKIDKEMEIF